MPIESFYVQAAYLLTGETVASRGLVRPRRPFDLCQGKVGPGAYIRVLFDWQHAEFGDPVLYRPAASRRPAIGF
ncbi:MAG: hypothetical protein IRY99_16295 [Isosphaeraceae bacterium]|nr:hypothetical protein [Isosphaeraceae bacterium]